MWAYPLYDQEDGGKHHKILVLEKQLADLPRGEPLTEHSATGCLVAVRKSPLLWHRGRLDQLSMYGKQLLATIFLIDYGEVMEGVKVDTCVKKVPSNMKQEPPMAFKILLSGLQSVSMDLDFMMGQCVMEATPKRDWDQAALVEVKRVVEEVDGVAELRDWVVDQSGRFQGQLYLIEETGRRVHLNKLLVDKQFAVESQWQVELDMAMTGDWENNKEYTALDTREFELMNWELDTRDQEISGQSLEQFTTEAFGESEVKDASITWDDLGHARSAGRGRGLKVDNETDVSLGGEVRRAYSLVGNGGDYLQTKRADKAKEFLDKLKKKKTGGSSEVVEKEEEDIWTALRGKKLPGGQDTSSTHLLPGGVFIGKYHENVLAHIQGENKMDQKKKFEQFVAPRKEDKL